MRDFLEVDFKRISSLEFEGKEEDGKFIFRLQYDDPEDVNVRSANILTDKENKRFINLKLLLTGWDDVGIQSRWLNSYQVFTIARDTVLPAHQLATCFFGEEKEGTLMQMDFVKGEGVNSRKYSDSTIVKKDVDGNLYLPCHAYIQ